MQIMSMGRKEIVYLIFHICMADEMLIEYSIIKTQEYCDITRNTQSENAGTLW